MPTATPVPATPVPAATATPDARGIVATLFSVRNAPGPYGNAGDIWFDMEIVNKGGYIDLRWLGVWVQETGDFHKSYGHAGAWTMAPNAVLHHEDHFNQFTLQQGTYHLWMRLCFVDETCVNISGPIAVTIG